MRGRHRFAIPFFRYLDEEGRPEDSLPLWTRDHDLLKAIYESMVLTRTFDQKAIALQRTGQLGTYPSTLGQEAIGTCIGLAMAAEDVLVPYYRDSAAQVLRGMGWEEILLYWGGDERGGNANIHSRDLPVCVPVATQLSQAAGVATAMTIKGHAGATVVTCGDGATSKGDFLEALNVAGVWHLPLVVVINNNQWAISVPLDQQTATASLAQKAIAAGIDGVQVDGNDAIAVYDALNNALVKARHNAQATLIEAVTYRLSDHTTADDASRYRSQDEVRKNWRHEPILRFRNFLHGLELWDVEQEQALLQNCQKTVDAAVDKYLAQKPEAPEAMIDYLYEFVPASLESQRAAIIAKAASLNKNHQGA